MKVLFVYDKGANCKYLLDILEEMDLLFVDNFYHRLVRLWEYETMDQNEFDVIIYQTYPDENNKGKFNKSLIEPCDKKFLEFKGKKFLLDSHDSVNVDGFKRFKDLNIPRIKNCAGYKCQEKLNVVFALPSYSMGWAITEPDMKLFNARPILIHCAFKTGGYPHMIRETIMFMLEHRFKRYTCFDRIAPDEYKDFLKSVQISITAPGFGECSQTVYHAMQAGCCLFAHEKFSRIKMMPHADLINGVDYMSFTLDNFVEQLDQLLCNPPLIEVIGRSGRNKFTRGMNISESCHTLLKILS